MVCQDKNLIKRVYSFNDFYRLLTYVRGTASMNRIMKKFPSLKVVFLLGVWLLVSACAAQMGETVDYQQDPKTLYNRAVLQEKSGNTRDASQTYISVWKLFPDHELAPQALYRAGSLLSAGNPARAAGLYRAFLESYSGSPLRPKVACSLLETEIELGRYSEAFDLLSRCRRRTAMPSS